MRRRFLYKKPAVEIPDWVEVGGVKWATRNIGLPGTFAETIYDYGMFYKFKDRKKVGWPSSGTISASNPASNGATEWYTEAYGGSYAGDWKDYNTPSPEGWRLPTGGPGGEFSKLASAFSVWDPVNKGRWFADNQSDLGDPKKSIFLPAAGLRDTSGAVTNQGTDGCYWAMNVFSYYNGYNLYFNSSNVYPVEGRSYEDSSAFPLRCVKIV